MLRRVIQPRWRIGIVENSLEGIVNGEELRVQWPSNPFHDRWFADPFVLSVDGDEVTLLVEDYRYAEGQGRISRIIVDRKRGAIVSCKTILRGGHYSFPAILRENGKVYLYPEQSRQGKLELYEYCPKTEACEYVQTLSEEPLTDAIIYKGVIYSTRLPEPNGKALIMFKWPSAVQSSIAASQRSSVFGDSKQLHCVQDAASQGSSVLRTFKSPSDVQIATSQRSSAFGGSMQLHCVQDANVLNLELETLNQPKTYVFGECIARNAGEFFEVDGVTYRPAQECNRWYGNALSIQLYENGEFKEVRRIPRLHTLNSYQGVTVVDRKVFPFQWVYWLLRRSDR